MKKSDAVILLLALTMAAPAAFPEPPRSREEALTALQSADAATRAEAVVWIANRGGAADDALLHERLRDESAFVRSYAEQALWLLWSRSGDAAIDRLMARGVDEMQRSFRRALEVNPNMVGVELELLRLEERLKGKRLST